VGAVTAVRAGRCAGAGGGGCRGGPSRAARRGGFSAATRTPATGCGVCVSWARHPDPGVVRFADQEGLLRSNAFLRGFATVAERGLSFDAFVYSHQLDDVATLAEEYPETPIVLDHYAPPVG